MNAGRAGFRVRAGALALCAAIAAGEAARAGAADAPATTLAPQTAPGTQREYIYGAELMTGKERERYRARLRGVQPGAGEEALREEHRRQIRERARRRGVQLEEPAGVIKRKQSER